MGYASEKWGPGNLPPDEEYWAALLRDGEHGKAAPVIGQMDYWYGREAAAPDRPARPREPEAAAEKPSGAAWDEARAVMERGEVLELPVVGYNRGGVLVEWHGLEGFVPASHLVNLTPFSDERHKYNELQRLVGSRLRLKVIELNPERERFILSERVSLVNEERRRELLDNLLPGDILQGRVTDLCSFGAFVDLGGVEGLIHVSELSWGRVAHPSDVLEPGQLVETYVLSVDRERGRVGLSTKRLQPDPWQSVDERYHVGQVIQGVVTHVVDFGAFVRVEEGLEGLVHVSELAEGNFVHPRNVVKEGSVVTVRILNIDSAQRRIGLSMRRVQ